MTDATNPCQFYLNALKVFWQKLQNDAGIPESGFTTGVPQSNVLNQMAYPAQSGLDAAEITTASEDTAFRNAHSGMGPIEYGSR